MCCERCMRAESLRLYKGLNLCQECINNLKEESLARRGIPKPVSIGTITQLIFDYAVECTDDKVSEKLYDLITMIDSKGIVL